MEHQNFVQAILYLKTALLMEPKEIKWKLLFANAHRRQGNLQMAFQTYEDIHEEFPENIECENQILIISYNNLNGSSYHRSDMKTKDLILLLL